MDGGVYIVAGNEVGSVWSEGIVCQCTCMGRGRGYHLPTFLGLPFLIWIFKKDGIRMLNNVIDALKALKWSV